MSKINEPEFRVWNIMLPTTSFPSTSLIAVVWSEAKHHLWGTGFDTAFTFDQKVKFNHLKRPSVPQGSFNFKISFLLNSNTSQEIVKAFLKKFPFYLTTDISTKLTQILAFNFLNSEDFQWFSLTLDRDLANIFDCNVL